MADKKKTDIGSASSDIEELLKERERLDKILKEKYEKELAILFSDICGYTRYIDERGDISGRAMLLRHNRILFPVIEKHEGEIVELIGDAIMAVFPSPLAAVKAATAMQGALNAYNVEIEPANRIHIKIGIHSGEVLVDDALIFNRVTGDVANVANRVMSQAVKDQILVSKAVYEEVCGSEDILCRFHRSVQVKGKPEPLEIFQVMWRDEEIILEKKPKVRLYKVSAEERPEEPLSVLDLEVAQERDRLRVSIQERVKGELSTIRHYEEIPVSMELISKRCHELVNTLNKANRRGRVTREVLLKLREIGQIFHDELFTHNVKEKLRNSQAEFLRLNLDEQLVHVPWELLYNGQHFLCQRFNMGRLVRTRKNILGTRIRSMARPLKMLILADPSGDLKGAYAEGTQIRDNMDQHKDLINVTLRAEDIKADSIKEKMRNFDIVHFAGHADYNPRNPEESGWRLSDGGLATKDIIKMAGTATMPALIFSNACQSARTQEWTISSDFQKGIFGLANVFLLVGVRHYMGTFWEILDEPSSRYALEFYQHLLSGVTMGEAVRQARMALIKEYGEETIVWASYLLYGDPTFNYMDQIKVQAPREEEEPAKIFDALTDVRAREEVIDFAEKEERKKGPRWLAVAAGILLLAALVFWGYPGLLVKGIGEYEREALAYYQAGDYSEAIKICQTLQIKSPQRSLGYLILANIHFLQGDLKKASGLFKGALEAENGTNSEKAEALIGLGRIASIEKNADQAVSFYQQAAELAPNKAQPYVSQGLLLDRQGKLDDALELFVKAHTMAPDDRSIRAIVNETRERAALTKNKEKRDRIDKLVRELLENFDKAVPQAPSDGWTSLPLTVWVMDFNSTGHSLREGEERLLAYGIMEQLIEKSRVQIVERVLFDRLLEELKLGTSRLVDSGTALSLGKIMAARVMLSGQTHHVGPNTQVAVRLIDIETGQVAAAVNEVFVSAVTPAVIAEKLSVTLLDKLETLYPLRGKISRVGEKGVILNIGTKHGVQIGQHFKVHDTDWILEVSAVQTDQSIAKVKRGYGTIKPGLRVEILQKGEKFGS